MIVNSINEVIEMNVPGFTAEHSLYRTDEHFHTRVLDTFRVFSAAVTPQLICQWNGGDLICGDEPFGGTPSFGNHSYAQCRAGCYHRSLRGAALRACLAEC
jgi:hypothetical protein